VSSRLQLLPPLSFLLLLFAESSSFLPSSLVLPVLLLLLTLRTRNERPDSSVRCHSTPRHDSSKGTTPHVSMLASRSLRKLSLSAVVSVMGRDRLICRGKGAPRSLVRKVLSWTGELNDEAFTSIDFCKDEIRELISS